jgi:hypothetical protein
MTKTWAQWMTGNESGCNELSIHFTLMICISSFCIDLCLANVCDVMYKLLLEEPNMGWHSVRQD